MARSRLPKHQVRRIRNWQTCTAEALDSSDGGLVHDKDDSTYDDHHQLDVSSVQGLGVDGAKAYPQAAVMEAGRIDFGEQHNTSRTFRKWFRKGAKVAFSPVSLPVRAILYAQRHWEEFLLGRLETAVQRLEAVNVPKLHLGHEGCIHLCSQDEIEAVRASKTSDPDIMATDLPSLAVSAAAFSPFSPLESVPVPQDHLTALRTLEEARLEYSHLPLAHAFNITTSSGRAQELPPSPPMNGTISRLDMSREDLERQTTKDTADYSFGPESTDVLIACGLALDTGLSHQIQKSSIPSTVTGDLPSPVDSARPKVSAPLSIFSTDLPSLAGSSVRTVSAPPSPASVALTHDSEGHENLAALRAFQETKFECLHLPLVRTLSLGSMEWQVQEL